MYIDQLILLHDKFPSTDSYPFNLALFHTTSTIPFARPVTFFIGENGTGKSTLLRAIARHCRIHIWQEETRTRFHFNPHEDRLQHAIDLGTNGKKIPGAFFASEIFRHFTEILDEWAVQDPGSLQYFGNTSLMEKSHGQSHMTYFKNRFMRPGLYLLDEPENALSPKIQLELLHLFRQATLNGNAQFIIASHSPILLAYPCAEIFSFNESPIRRVRYEETDYFRVYLDFLNNREYYLKKLQ